MPLIRRVPKRGFNNAVFHTNYALVNLNQLEERFEAGATVDEAALLEAGLIRRPYDGVKVLGRGELKKKLSITVDKASASAKSAIEKAGGTLTTK
jgi:large subunit ribosomal protein L15